MKKLLLILPLVFLLCFTFGYQKQAEEEKPAVDITADIEALKDMNNERIVASFAGELDRMVSFYFAEDAVVMPTNKPIFKGREAILASYKRSRYWYSDPE